MREKDAHAARIAEIFDSQNRTLSASDLIESGVNPLFAWFHVRGINPEILLTKTNFAQRMLSGWPASLPKPDPETLLEWILLPRQADELHATHVGQISMDWKGIYDACVILKITPDKLMPRNYSVYSRKFVTEPAPAEIIEASVHLFEDMGDVGMHRPLLDFLVMECQKADRIGFQKLLPHFKAHEDMMALAESAYDTMAEDTPEALMAADGDKPEKASPIFIIREEIDRICIEYERQMGIFIRNLSKDITVLSAGFEAHGKVISACASAIAPMMKGSDWLTAFNDVKTKEGLEPAIKKLMADPAAFHPVRMFLDGASTILPDGRTVRGHGIVKAFCEAYRAFSKCHRDGGPKKVAEVEAKRDEAIDKLTDFRTWRTSPQAETYFAALANARYIEQEMGGWVPGPQARQTPREAVPILRLPKPQPPANT